MDWQLSDFVQRRNAGFHPYHPTQAWFFLQNADKLDCKNCNLNFFLRTCTIFSESALGSCLTGILS
jgi:hypothetical protein